MSLTHPSASSVLVIYLVIYLSVNKCVYKVHDDGRPEKVDS